ncbi:MAG TPA: M1 family aminopeptidase [Jiangellales bacterium]|nr:M1 family aminopeptidase [Jiangellales bacterium]
MTTAARPVLVVAAAVLTLAASCAPAGGDVDPATLDWPDPSPTRPVVDLTFDVAGDLRSVEGTERVDFTPDLEVCELVFRAWPNKPFLAEAGSALEVTEVLVDSVEVEPEVSPGGAPEGSPGTLVEVPLPECVDAGTTVTADLRFTVTLGEGVDERVGTSRMGDVAWFGTAFPLLAWEEGRGWARDEAVPVVGETTTSETFELRSLEVVAPEGYEVLGTGSPAGEEAAGDGMMRHRFTAPAVRDVTVTVGRLDLATRDVGDVRVRVGTPGSGSDADPEVWAEQVAEAVERVGSWLGPVPYPDVWVSVLPDQTDGIEFPGAVQFGDVSPVEESWLVTHEVAHLWFYGLVGNNQARDPWLDEALATFVQMVTDPEGGGPSPNRGESYLGEVGQPMDHWLDYRRPSTAYVRGVYLAGGAALLEARARAGAEAFDEALRGYLRDNAHRVATPEDVEAAFAELPEVLEVLRDAGALEGGR